MTVNLQAPYLVGAARIIWRDIGLDYDGGTVPGPIRFILEGRPDNDIDKWITLVDASDNDTELHVDYREIKPVSCESVRLRIMRSSGRYSTRRYRLHCVRRQGRERLRRRIMNENRIFEMSRAGVLPDTTADCTDRIGAVLAENEENVTYLFEKGVYRFHASNGLIREYSLSNTDGAQYERTLSLLIKDRKNITIDGGGATFVFYGHLQPFTIDGCENITLKNLVIDWEKPLVSEGEIVGRSADFIDVRINQNLFPCRVRDYSMYFDIGDGEESELTYGDHTIYNPDTLKVTPRSSDIVKVKSVEALSDDTFRLYTDDILPPGSPPRVGDLIVLRHNKHIHSGIFAENSTGIICESLTLYSCGEGLLFQFCRDVTCRNITIAPNRGIGRKIACSRDYGIQVSGCGGALTIEGCRFHGLQDDPVNIHSVGVRLDRINEDGTLTGSFARPGISNFRALGKNRTRTQVHRSPEHEIHRRGKGR